MKEDDKLLQEQLSAIEIQPPSSNLAARIISASQEDAGDTTGEETTLYSLIENYLFLFRPAPVLTAMLVVGTLSGWYMTDNLEQNNFVVEDELTEFIDYEVSML